MISPLLQKKAITIVFGGVLFLSVRGCYTSFTHPDTDKARWGDVRVSDDCAECHNANKFVAPILPDGAALDYAWEFYAGSSWWQDQYTLDTNDAIQPRDPTGPRTPPEIYPGVPPTIGQPVVQGGGSSLGKRGATEDEKESQQSDRRDFNRRVEPPESENRSIDRRSEDSSEPKKEDSGSSSRSRGNK